MPITIQRFADVDAEKWLDKYSITISVVDRGYCVLYKKRYEASIDDFLFSYPDTASSVGKIEVPLKMEGSDPFEAIGEVIRHMRGGILTRGTSQKIEVPSTLVFRKNR